VQLYIVLNTDTYILAVLSNSLGVNKFKITHECLLPCRNHYLYYCLWLFPYDITQN